MVWNEIKRIDYDPIAPHLKRLYIGASLIALIGNILLTAAKGIVAWVSGSSAIYADAANSASDVAYSLSMMIGLWLSLRPSDESHPHGHRRIEPLVSLLIGLMMALAGVEAARTAWQTWRQGPLPITSAWAYAIPLITVAVKGGMYWRVKALGERARSPALLASARDNLSDVVSSTLALLGVLGSQWLFPSADPLAALLVAAWILWAAWGVLRESVSHLTGGAGSTELSQAIFETASAVPGVVDVHQVIIEHVGPEVRADIHINMSGDATLDEVHRVSDDVRHAVEALERVEHAFVHVEPTDHQSESS